MIKKDMLELCILHLLSENDMYGYEALHKLKSVFPQVKESEIYVLLRGLFRDGYTECYDGTTSDGPVRKYYKITHAGQEKKAALLCEWRQLCEAFKRLGIDENGKLYASFSGDH